MNKQYRVKWEYKGFEGYGKPLSKEIAQKTADDMKSANPECDYKYSIEEVK